MKFKMYHRSLPFGAVAVVNNFEFLLIESTGI